ncbi:hypothetical protein SAMN04487965_2192 [Microbulbifer donghaiensis]|uniref:Lipoprotein n=1 Tax=Microbulbifer donghaiensis TaxID=494016 RepID=A0A1M5CGZ4_9GAMM|nr:hypothetical protein [Microbulbifer donghaiensis]SHF53950.1 hypothetical protein SAMN04487965_2192 [Microbulbifer donghaiensis]
MRFFPILARPILGLFGAATAVLLLSGCTSTPAAPNPGLKESFHTEISANGSKRFTYALEMTTPLVRGPYTQSPTARGGMVRTQDMPGRQPPGNRGLDFDHALNLKLQETGFCLDGYFVIERSVSPMNGEVRGECREGVQR